MRHFAISLLTAAFLPLFISPYAQAQQKSLKAYVTLFPAGDFIATTTDITGFAEIVSATEVKAKDIKINLKSIKTGFELRDQHAKNKYLEVAKYPEAILMSATGKNGTGTGILKMHGKESKIDGTYQLLAGNKFLKAEFKTKLSSYDIKEINYKGVGVEDEIKIEIVVPVQSTGALPVGVKKK